LSHPGRTRTCDILLVRQASWPLDDGTRTDQIEQSPRWESNPQTPASHAGSFAGLPTRRSAVAGLGVEPRDQAYEARLSIRPTCKRECREQPVGESNPPLLLEKQVSLPIDEQARKFSECAGQELNLQSPKAGGLRPLGHTNAQPTRSAFTRESHGWDSNPQSRRFEPRRSASWRTVRSTPSALEGS
jgi:hypothetical protein